MFLGKFSFTYRFDRVLGPTRYNPNFTWAMILMIWAIAQKLVDLRSKGLGGLENRGNKKGD